MKKSRSLFILVLLLALLASSSAWTHNRSGPWHGHGSAGPWPVHGHWHGGHSHGHVGVFIGVPLGAPWYYNPYYTYPPVVTVPATPPVYIQQGLPVQNEQQSNSWWYYCKAPQGYYPYVKQCPSGWQLVPAQPPDLDPDLR
ncbi:MAG TPA: hypothetical protein VF427_13150 [Noviherbaspirillum sp.]